MCSNSQTCEVSRSYQRPRDRRWTEFRLSHFKRSGTVNQAGRRHLAAHFFKSVYHCPPGLAKQNGGFFHRTVLPDMRCPPVP
ncbi:hypothetical protein UPYG_G00157710 [Umbra pygmaea]|uniref:Uncharacterized protein n=1 Tax=Umbra pygmaea TaxID=75934 RepID=A0ABD0WZU6_UMBPY